MGKYEENISDDSLWITVTPTPLAKTLPFFVSEAGHFMAYSDYKIQRDTHDSFLLIYTVSGQGFVRTENTGAQLSPGTAILLDCHMPHEYHSTTDGWEFLWIHFHGIGVPPIIHILYPECSIRAVCVEDAQTFENRVSALVDSAARNDVAGCIQISSEMHALLNILCLSALESEKSRIERESADDIQTVVKFIEAHYPEAVSIDDMVRDIHVSKYHFIRRFHRAMGITPYSYLTNYRINVSKMLLRTTDKTVEEIARSCGFLDTSNFITHFKKHTGQKPLQYRRDFS